MSIAGPGKCRIRQLIQELFDITGIFRRIERNGCGAGKRRWISFFAFRPDHPVDCQDFFAIRPGDRVS
jgi:hypothetical protein